MKVEQNFELVTFTDGDGIYIADFRDDDMAAKVALACKSHEQLVTALQKIASADMGEGGCYYTNRENILTARRALKEAGIQP